MVTPKFLQVPSSNWLLKVMRYPILNSPRGVNTYPILYFKAALKCEHNIISLLYEKLHKIYYDSAVRVVII